MLRVGEVAVNLFSLRQNTLTTYDHLLNLLGTETYNGTFYDLTLSLRNEWINGYKMSESLDWLRDVVYYGEVSIDSSSI